MRAHVSLCADKEIGEVHLEKLLADFVLVGGDDHHVAGREAEHDVGVPEPLMRHDGAILLRTRGPPK